MFYLVFIINFSCRKDIIDNIIIRSTCIKIINKQIKFWTFLSFFFQIANLAIFSKKVKLHAVQSDNAYLIDFSNNILFLT